MARGTPSGIPDHLLRGLENLTIDTSAPHPIFWDKFPEFDFDVKKHWEYEFVRLARSRKWKPDGKRYNKELRACYTSLDQHVHESDTASEVSTASSCSIESLDDQLAHLHGLCEAVGLEPASSVTQCKLRLKKVHVNLKDFVRARALGQTPVLFPSYAALIKYTLGHKSRKMNRQEAKRLGLQVFLKTFY